MKKLTGIILLLMWLSGCVPAAIVYGAYKISEAKTESAQKMQRSSDLRTYSEYQLGMERVNLDREKSKLKPSPIMTQEEWISAQTAGRPAIAPAK